MLYSQSRQIQPQPGTSLPMSLSAFFARAILKSYCSKKDTGMMSATKKSHLVSNVIPDVDKLTSIAQRSIHLILPM